MIFDKEQNSGECKTMNGQKILEDIKVGKKEWETLSAQE